MRITATVLALLAGALAWGLAGPAVSQDSRPASSRSEAGGHRGGREGTGQRADRAEQGDEQQCPGAGVVQPRERVANRRFAGNQERFRVLHRALFLIAGTPATVDPAGTSRSTTAPAATTAVRMATMK